VFPSSLYDRTATTPSMIRAGQCFGGDRMDLTVATDLRGVAGDARIAPTGQPSRHGLSVGDEVSQSPMTRKRQFPSASTPIRQPRYRPSPNQRVTVSSPKIDSSRSRSSAVESSPITAGATKIATSVPSG
jgi:hypothetical protein